MLKTKNLVNQISLVTCNSNAGIYWIAIISATIEITKSLEGIQSALHPQE